MRDADFLIARSSSRWARFSLGLSGNREPEPKPKPALDGLDESTCVPTDDRILYMGPGEQPSAYTNSRSPREKA
jgi:hypothetical protein